jgi:sortase A
MASWIQRMLLAGALVSLAWCGFVLLDSWRFQDLNRRHLEQTITVAQGASLDTLRPSSPPLDSLIGRIEVLRLGLSAVVMEGTSTITLRRAAGHIAGTALPGSAGNVGIAAHRDTFFRPLRNIRWNDIILLTTAAGKFRYRVVSMRVVHPEDVSVLEPTSNEILTLVTCYPFYFIGSAPDRFIVRAERIA